MKLYAIGTRFTPAKATKIHDKLARRVLRARAMTAHVRRGDRTLQEANRADLEVARLASNSHERRRAIAADRKERSAARKEARQRRRVA